jgi:hypothetical protein
MPQLGAGDAHDLPELRAVDRPPRNTPMASLLATPASVLDDVGVSSFSPRIPSTLRWHSAGEHGDLLR